MENEDVQAAITSLKSAQRRTVAISVCCIAILVALTTFDRIAATKELKCHRLVLVDASGKSVATLEPKDNGACLALSTITNNSIARICAGDEDGTYLSLITHKGETQAIFSTGELIHEPLYRFPPGLVVSTEYGQKVFRVMLGENSELSLGDSSSLRGMTVVVPSKGQTTLHLKPDSGSDSTPAGDTLGRKHRNE